MKSLKMISATIAMLSLAACSQPGGNAVSSVSCDDRFCSMSQPLALDQTDITGSSSFVSNSIKAQSVLDDLLSLTPSLTLVGTLAVPTVNGAAVQASDITVNGTKVYVAYNTAGEVQAGAIDVIDISNPNAASLSSQALYPTTDINKLKVSGGKLYAAGADGNGSMLTRITLDAAGKLTSTVTSVALRGAASASIPAYAGTSVTVAGNYVYALSGNNGGLSILNLADLSTSAFTAIPDARDISLDASSSSLYVVTGKTNTAEALINHYSLVGAALGTGNITLPNAVANDQAKSTIQTGSIAHVATAGYGGAKLMCLDGTTLGTATNPNVSGLTAAKEVANAAAFGAGYMFVANGEAGVSVYSVNVPLIPIGCNLVSITYLGRLSLGTGTSANNVFYSSGYLVVATGSGGFKIIKVTTSLLSGLLQAL